MTGEKKERWMELCERAANEQDREKFYDLVMEVSRLLKEKEDRFKASTLRKESESQGFNESSNTAE
jgi:hypothetical protein